MEKFRALAAQIKSGLYILPVEGQLVEPAGRERHTKSTPAEAT
jgi:hypothetical protein